VAVELDTQLETQAINTIRMLSVDAVQKANSGHPGLPMGAASIGYVLWQEFLKHNPTDPEWFDRDRFVLSAGHGSMLLYSLLHLTGYDLPMEQLQRFRQLGSRTPGHPERGHTAGVEVTTGPLGQGFANAVGLAIAEAHLAARYNRPDHEVINHRTFVICSDGDLMEGVAMEAASLAGHLRLGKLIALYDQNHITLAGTANLTFSEEIEARFRAIGWHAMSIDGMDPNQVRWALGKATEQPDQPTLIACRTTIGYGSPNKQNTFGVHGSPLGVDEVAATKEALGWPLDPPFFVPAEVRAHFQTAIERGQQAQAEWQTRFEAYRDAHPELAAELEMAIAGQLPEGWDADLPTWQAGEKVATRKASEKVIQAFFPRVPTFIGGSADLNPSTNTAMKGGGDFEPPAVERESVQGLAGGERGYAGRNIHFGVREHAMGAAVNGMAAHGGLIPFGATFLVFADYCRPAIRLAALSRYRSIFVFTHDSVAVGEDGPTHEPVEHVMSLRLIPNLTVLRPADANETAAAWRIALTNAGPTVLVLSRQDLTVLEGTAKGAVERGAYILLDQEAPDIVLIGTGSEVELAVMAAGLLAEHGVQARVVSMPSWELFERQPESYRSWVLGEGGVKRLTVEAGVTIGWERYGDRAVGINRFGASAPGSEVLALLGMTKERVAAEAARLIGRADLADLLEPPPAAGETAGEEATGAEGHS
jgi:transketolase